MPLPMRSPQHLVCTIPRKPWCNAESVFKISVESSSIVHDLIVTDNAPDWYQQGLVLDRFCSLRQTLSVLQYQKYEACRLLSCLLSKALESCSPVPSGDVQSFNRSLGSKPVPVFAVRTAVHQLLSSIYQVQLIDLAAREQ